MSGLPMQRWLTVPCDWRRPEQAQPYDLYWCASSGYGKVYPSPNVDEVSGFYDIPYYTHGVTATVDNPSVDWMIKLRQHLAWRFDGGVSKTEHWWRQLLGGTNVASKRVCELGCGSGHNLMLLRELGCTVLGVEPDPRARQVAQDNGLTVLAGTAEALPQDLGDQTFDLLLMNHVLEHCLEPKQVVQNAHKLLNPQGFLVVETPNSTCLGGQKANIAWPFLDVPRHLHFFTAQSLQTLCEQESFRWLKTEYEGYFVQFEQGWLESATEIWHQLGYGERTLTDEVRSAWQLLAQTALAQPAQKYCSVRVVMQR
jgi:2-polyprenyl-3-methyl-5-hydroxy-6-metoxy-1,4-benzoquinol methylase